MSSCSLHDCTLEVFENKDKCILHCEKDEKLLHGQFINNFWIEIKKIIIDINMQNDNISNIGEEALKCYVFSDVIFPDFKYQNKALSYNTKDDYSVEIFSYFKYDTPIKFENCQFVNKVYIPDKINPKNIIFYDCKFYNSNIKITEQKVAFQICEFYGKFTIEQNFKEIDDYFVFINCEFYSRLLILGVKSKMLSITSKLFKECFFYQIVRIYNTYVDINELFYKCEFLEKFSIRISNSKINANIDFNLRKVNEIKFLNSTFNGYVNLVKENEELTVVQFYKCQFNNLVTINIIKINQLSINESKFTESFNLLNVNIQKNKISLSYFKTFNIMQEVTLSSNLDLSTCLFEKANFLKLIFNNDANVENRETARIIKDSFEQQNNIIEANKFYALEMKKREKELDEDRKKGKNIFEWFVFKVHGLASNHSQDWVLALIWICIFGLIGGIYQFYFLETAHKVLNEKTLDFALGSAIFLSVCLYIYFMLYGVKKYSLYLVIGSLLVAVYLYLTKDYTFTYFSKSINPFSMMNGNEDINLIELLFKVVFSYLIYQLIISIRQNTRRK